MKSEIQSLMKQNHIDAIIVSGSRQHNPQLAYFVGNNFFTFADVIIPQIGEPVLFYRVMERDCAKQTGIKCVCQDELLRENKKPDELKTPAEARAWALKVFLNSLPLTKGNIAFCGRLEFGEAYAAIEELKKLEPDFHICGDEGNGILCQARYTKDMDELRKIRHMGEITTEVVGRVEQFIRSGYLKDGKAFTKKDEPITIGMIKSKINLWLGELGAENPEGTIFSLGHDAAVPHNSGNDAEQLREGESIVYDFFPCENGGGYYYDFTRTWALGYAPDYLQRAYDTVKKVHDEMIAVIKPGVAFVEMQKKTCEAFVEFGHETVGEKPGTTNGFVHSVGHGLGLNIHERPFSGRTASLDDKLIPGAVFTIEPGLYYPDAKDTFGCRIEDTLYMDENGEVHIFSSYPYHLVIEMERR